MKVTFLILLFCLPIFFYGQTNASIKEIFYNLPLDASRKMIKKQLASDKTFLSSEKPSDTAFIFLEDTFLGLCNNNGLIRTVPDSVEVELTFGYSLSREKKKGNNRYSNDLFLKLRYYYSIKDSAEKEYHSMLGKLRPLTKDTLPIEVDTIYSDSPNRSKLKAKGTEFIFHKPDYKVTVLSVSITENCFGLFLEYTRKEN
jgi:hypothetical protein